MAKRPAQGKGTRARRAGRARAARTPKAGAAAPPTLFEAAPDAIIGIDKRGRIRLANLQAERLFGYTRRELLGAPVERLMPSRFRAAHAQHRDGYFVNPRPRPMGAGFELFARRKDGTEFPVDVSLTAVETARGRLGAAFVRDITERKAAEERIRQANRDLESFSHTISHDLRTPLRAVRGFSQALAEDYAARLDDTGRDFLKRIDVAGQVMEHLIEDLLEYSRIGRRQVEVRAVKVADVVAEVLRPLAPDIERARAKVEVKQPLMTVMGEPQLLGQIMGNLVSNALKYVAPGSPPFVRISTSQVGGRVRILVEDKGLGIERHHLERIWQPFERLHSAEAYPGTGVGLAIVRRAAERLGGTTGVESTPGKGSRFWIDLPSAGG